jgi:hypothetical protein
MLRNVERIELRDVNKDELESMSYYDRGYSFVRSFYYDGKVSSDWKGLSQNFVEDMKLSWKVTLP